MEFQDFFKLSYKVAHYGNLMREDIQRKFASYGTYYEDTNLDLDVAKGWQTSLLFAQIWSK